MRRTAQPQHWHEERFVAQNRLGAPRDFAADERIGGERQMMAVLLLRAQGNNHDFAGILARLAPVELRKLHKINYLLTFSNANGKPGVCSASMTRLMSSVEQSERCRGTLDCPLHISSSMSAFCVAK